MAVQFIVAAAAALWAGCAPTREKGKAEELDQNDAGGGGAADVVQDHDVRSTSDANAHADGLPDTPVASIRKWMAVVAGGVFGDPKGSISTIGLDESREVSRAIAATDSTDVVVRRGGEYVYVINRYGADSVQVLNPSDNFRQVAGYSVGNGSNPQDIVVVGEKAYVSRLDAQNDVANKGDVLVVNSLTGEILNGIDLTPYTTDDGERLARAAQMTVAGGYLYVACQDLSSGFVADTNGKLAVIDIETNEVFKSIELTGRNPADVVFWEPANKILVSNTGVFDPATLTTDTSTSFGGIEVVDTRTNETEGIKVDDADLGGYVSELRIVSADLGYVITSSAALASFNPSTYEVMNRGLYTSPGFYMPDIALWGGQILLTERDAANSGVVFINRDGSIAAGPVEIGTMPASIAIVEVEK